ncbi:hypothetical protein SAMN04487957_105134 [Halomonas shengliensis]|uniref:Uncharacterized protein n=1 Tax=Halomonas shengliensis TaxID=419597 RepID=A0A1H0II48_9GAMM|nr:hypothetical protein [Halomonas shengliensis]SDO31149.1 hypothetical protein SAMN04487957_105134 [Halomonas shengliensis]
MSNGPYGQLACGCGAVTLLVCGAPLGHARDAEDEPVSLWPEEAIQLGQGADELAVVPDARCLAAWQCRRCGERLLYADDEAGVAVLADSAEEGDEAGLALTTSQQRWLAALGYRVDVGP